MYYLQYTVLHGLTVNSVTSKMQMLKTFAENFYYYMKNKPEISECNLFHPS